MSPVVFHPKARDAIRTFPQAVRDRLGKALYLLQVGEQPAMPLSRPMPSVAPVVSELRLRGEDGQKTQQTPAADIELGRRRLKELSEER